MFETTNQYLGCYGSITIATTMSLKHLKPMDYGGAIVSNPALIIHKLRV